MRLEGSEHDLQRAAALTAQSNFDGAVLVYQDLAIRNPRSIPICLLLGRALCAAGQAASAVAWVDEFLNKNPDLAANSELYFVTGFAHELQRQWTQAIRYYELCLYFDPNHFDALFNQGNAYLELGELQNALTRFERVLLLQPSHERALNNAGLACAGLGETQRGLDYFEAASTANPNFVQALRNRAWTLHAGGAFESALQRFTELLAHPAILSDSAATVDAHSGLGLTLFGLHRVPEALHQLNTAFTLAPPGAELFNNRGTVLKALGRFEEAIADFNAALSLRSDYAQAHSNLGNVYRERGQFEEALMHFESACALQPGFAQAQLNRSLVLLDMGRFEEGFEAYGWRWAAQSFNGEALRTNKPEWEPEVLGPALSKSYRVSNPTEQSKHSKLRLLIWNEQGLGDDIYFVRFLPFLLQSLCTPNPWVVEGLFKAWEVISDDTNKEAQNAGNQSTERHNKNPQSANAFVFSPCISKLIVRVDPRLVDLLRDSFVGVEFVPEGEPLSDEAFDVHLAMGELARLVLRGRAVLERANSGVTQATKESEKSVTAPVLPQFSGYLQYLSYGYLRAAPTRVTDLREQIVRAQITYEQSKYEQNTVDPTNPDPMSSPLRAANNAYSVGKAFIIGLSWLSTHPLSGAKRSIALNQFVQEGLIPKALERALKEARVDATQKINRICFVNLQHASDIEQIQVLCARESIYIQSVPGVDIEQDIHSLAALIKACDVVLSIDNTTAHLSAALGVQTCVLLPISADWRWQNALQKDSHFAWLGYPAAQVFRQLVWGEWSAPLARAAQYLRELFLSKTRDSNS